MLFGTYAWQQKPPGTLTLTHVIVALQTFKVFTLGASDCEKYIWYIVVTVWTNRPLATQERQRITTPAALGNSFSSTIWRVVSSEGRASFVLWVFLLSICTCFVHLWVALYLSSVCASLLLRIDRHSQTSFEIFFLCFFQGRYWEVPPGKVSTGFQRSKRKVVAMQKQITEVLLSNSHWILCTLGVDRH